MSWEFIALIIIGVPIVTVIALAITAWFVMKAYDIFTGK